MSTEVNILSLYVFNKVKSKLRETKLYFTTFGNFKLKLEGIIMIIQLQNLKMFLYTSTLEK